MGWLNEVTFQTWNEFKVLFREYLSASVDGSREFLYRGCRDSDWNLETSFHRAYGEVRKFFDETSDFGNSDESLFGYFRDALPGEMAGGREDLRGPDGKILMQKILQLFALGQHYGLPTPVLDWTESPYIAAYFAYREALISFAQSHDVEGLFATNAYIAIWAFDRSNGFWTSESLLEEEKKGVTYFRDESFENERIIRQKGWLTFQDGCKHTLNLYIDELERHGKLKSAVALPLLWKFQIPLREAHSAMRDLGDMRIDSAELLPGFEGATKKAVDEYNLKVIFRDLGK